MNPFLFGTETPEGKLILRNEHDFVGVYRNKLFQKITERRLIDVSFVFLWLKDEKMRTYDRLDFLPCQQCQFDIYNTFTSFEAENKPLIKTNIKKILKLVSY